MRRIIGPIGAALAIAAFMATLAAPAGAQWEPLQHAAGGPYFGKLDPSASYYY